MSSTTKSRGGNTANRPNLGNLLNLERVPGLAPKFANQIGKTCTQFRVLYTAVGSTVEVASTIGPKGEALTGDGTWISIPEWERRRALKNAPTDAERLSALKRKYELRLNREFPSQGPSSGKEEDIQSWIRTLPFQQRRALLMSQKVFKDTFPEGFRDPQ